MRKTTIYLLCLVVVGIIASVGIVSAFGAGFVTEGQGLAIKQAIGNNDFKAWKTAVTETLTQENFDKLVARHKAMEERKELRDAMKQAVADGNYDAYKKAFEGIMGSYKVMSEEDFNTLVERYNTGGLSHLGRFGFPERVSRHHVGW